MTEEDNPAASPSTGPASGTPAPQPEPVPPPGPDGDAGAAAGESAAGTIDGQSPAASARRFLPPDGKPMVWYVRHREAIRIAELAVTGLFFLVTLYFLWLWIFGEPKVSYEPGREGFIRTMALYAPPRPDASWRVKATPGRWRNIVVHHTATGNGDPVAIDRFHREVKKWENGLGYHFLIGNGNGLGDGEVYPSRRWLEQLDGAHVQMRGHTNGNTFAIGIALVGNFEETMATPRQLASLRSLLHFLMMEYGIMHSEVVGHGDVSARHTACPGKYLFIDEIVKSL